MFREITLDNILFPIRVQHSHLNNKERVDSKASRIDTLILTINIQYEHLEILEYSFINCFSWSNLYNFITNFEVPTITAPLEFILEQILDFIQNEANNQNINLYNISIFAKRIGLIKGHIELISKREFKTAPNISFNQSFRSAGVMNAPLHVKINRDWIDYSHIIDEEQHVFETFEISFKINIATQPISLDNLYGLFNYSTAYDIIQKSQGFTLNSTIEFLLDHLRNIILKSAKEQSVQVLSGFVSISRKNYARVNPTFSLIF